MAKFKADFYASENVFINIGLKFCLVADKWMLNCQHVCLIFNGSYNAATVRYFISI